MPTSKEPDAREEHQPPDDKSDVLPARVYWVVAGLALAMMAFLYWLTATFNVPLGPA